MILSNLESVGLSLMRLTGWFRRCFSQLSTEEWTIYHTLTSQAKRLLTNESLAPHKNNPTRSAGKVSPGISFTKLEQQ